MSKHHSISCYDKNLCLKPDITIWLILLFFLRACLVLVLSLVNMRDRTALIDMVYPDRLAMSLSALAGVPAALLVYAWVKRNPGATPFVKKIWRNGRLLLVASALLNIAIVFLPVLTGSVHRIYPGDWAQFGISLLILVVVLMSSYIRDCFNDFPGDEDSGEE